MDNNNLKEKFKFRIAISKLIEESEKKSYKKHHFMSKKVAAACACVILTSGIAFAKEIENFIKEKFHLGEGIQTAVDNGYIEHINEEYMHTTVSVTKEKQETIIDTFDVGIKINDFMITDTNLSIEFEAKFDEKINMYKDLSKKVNGNTDFESFGYLELTDLFVLDEENNLIYSSINQEYFESFCKEHNLDYKYQNYNDNYLFSTAQSTTTEINESANSVKFIYNISISNGILEPHHLTIYFNKMKFSPKPKFGDINDEFTLTGQWAFNLDVPEFMYNHKDLFYKVVSCEVNDFEIYEAKATDIGFEIGIMVSNIEKPVMPEKLQKRESELMSNNGKIDFATREDFINLFGGEEYAKMYEEYMYKTKPINTNGFYYSWKKMTDGCYILNSEGNKFECSYNNLGRKASAEFIEGNKYNYYQTFEMTKYNATDRITAVIEFYGKPVKIELEIIK